MQWEKWVRRGRGPAKNHESTSGRPRLGGGSAPPAEFESPRLPLYFQQDVKNPYSEYHHGSSSSPTLPSLHAVCGTLDNSMTSDFNHQLTMRGGGSKRTSSQPSKSSSESSRPSRSFPMSVGAKRMPFLRRPINSLSEFSGEV